MSTLPRKRLQTGELSELLTMLCKSQSASKLVKRIIIVFVHGDFTDSSTFICLAALEAYIKYE